jgi:hypothetical protein
LQIIAGDLLAAKEPERLIAHQCNCVTTGTAAGFARALFERHPAAGYGSTVTLGRQLGNVQFVQSEGGVTIANMYAQYYPGPPTNAGDGAVMRVDWFRSCLEQLAVYAKAHNKTRVAMPYGVGCGLAGGRWAEYQALLQSCAERHRLHIVLYRI